MLFWNKIGRSVLLGIITLFPVAQSYAVTTVPETLVYQGELKTTAGVPLSGSYFFRLSLWDNIDHLASDVSGTNINAAAPNYLGWQEVHSYNVVDGKFALDIGGVTPLPNTDIFNRPDIFLQVEIGTTLTTLELVDSRPEANIDRLKFFSMPYAFNADKLDWRDSGFGADEVPYLDGSGKLPESTIPGGTTADGFTINSDGTEGFLQFGNDIADRISFIFASDIWDFAAKRITNILDPTNPQDAATKSYVDSVVAGGGAPITGIDGNTFTLDEDTDAGAGDSIGLSFGSTGETFNWNGTTNQFEFSDDVDIAGNLTVSGTINGISIGPKEEHKVFVPHYDGMIFEADGTNNKGGMYDGSITVGADKKNILKWKSRESTLQDYTIQIRYELPQDFVGFVGASPVEISYLTEGASSDSALDIVIEKEGSATDELTGTGVGLANNTFTTGTLNLNPGTTWNAGDVVLISIKPYSKDQNIASIGDVVLKYVVH